MSTSTSALVARTPEPWDAEADFLDRTWALANAENRLRAAIVLRALRDQCTLEEPLGSNRGRRIDHWLRRAGVPEALIISGQGLWCGAWTGAVWIDAGALVPRDYASADAWLPFLEPAAYEPQAGDVVLYGVPGDAQHLGIVLVPSPRITIEGNRALKGFSNNGIGVFSAAPTRTDVLGYVRPRAISTPAVIEAHS